MRYQRRRMSMSMSLSKTVSPETACDTLITVARSRCSTGEHGRDVDLLAMHANAAAGGDDEVAVVPRIGEIRQA